jgi:hypothetical protein
MAHTWSRTVWGLLPNGLVAHALGQKLQDLLFSVRESHGASSSVRNIAQGTTYLNNLK